MCRDGLNGIHEVSIGLAIGWLASVSVHTFNLHERALNNVSVSVESHLHHCVKWNLDIWKILYGQFHEVGVNAPHHSLMGDNQQVVAAIHLRENLRQTPADIDVRFSVWVSVSEFVSVPVCELHRVFLGHILVSHPVKVARLDLIQLPLHTLLAGVHVLGGLVGADQLTRPKLEIG